MRCTTFAQASPDEAAAALTRVFEEYFVPMQFNAEQFRLHVEYNELDTALSPLWYDDDGAVVAAALLGFRESRAWIGGFGIAPPYRRQGYGARLLRTTLDAARSADGQSVTLEVLMQNTAAIALYAAAGFTSMRQLIAFESIATAQDIASNEVVEADPEPLLDEQPDVAPCWQREMAALRKGAARSAVSDGAGNYALFRHDETTAQVLKVAATSKEGLRKVSNAIRNVSGAGRLSLSNEPAESAVAAYAKAAGWTERLVQYEMRLSLG